MNINDFDISNPVTAVVTASERITPAAAEAEVRHIILRVDQERLSYEEGQSVGVLVPGPHEFGNRYYMRLYSIASPHRGEAGKPDMFSLCVRRCFGIDPVSGERYPGKASNYICDLKAGDSVQITGPYGLAFAPPKDPASNLIMIGAGTGIAPFRAFLQHIYEEQGGWKGLVRLFYGARSGAELLYMNDQRKDISLYYTRNTFKAFEALSPRPHFDEAPDIERPLNEHASEIWKLIRSPKTHVYLAGSRIAAEKFDRVMIHAARSDRAWFAARHELVAQRRYSELLYD